MAEVRNFHDKLSLRGSPTILVFTHQKIYHIRLLLIFQTPYSNTIFITNTYTKTYIYMCMLFVLVRFFGCTRQHTPPMGWACQAGVRMAQISIDGDALMISVAS